jgi:hypothetical protein
VSVRAVLHRLATLACGLALGGCAAASRLTAPVDDYQLYRATRLGPTLEARLTAANQYLNRMPNGVFRKQVLRWFQPEEKRYFRRAWRSLPRLRAYLAAMPDGPNAEVVAERIVELELEQQFAKNREERELSAARRIGRELDAAAAARRNFVGELSAWVAKLSAIRSFGESTAELDHELIHRFRLSEPPGRCLGDRCRKLLSFGFKVPSDKQLVEREAIAEVEFGLDASGALASARIGGPDLFSRLDEAIELRTVTPEDAQARAEAIARAAQLVAHAVETALPAGECERQPVSPVILVRACRGIELVVIAGMTIEEDDRIEVRAVLPP